MTFYLRYVTHERVSAYEALGWYVVGCEGQGLGTHTVLSPFMGIGSEGHVALKLGRKFVGFELNPTYYAQAAKHLESAETLAASGSLLSLMEATP